MISVADWSGSGGREVKLMNRVRADAAASLDRAETWHQRVAGGGGLRWRRQWGVGRMSGSWRSGDRGHAGRHLGQDRRHHVWPVDKEHWHHRHCQKCCHLQCSWAHMEYRKGGKEWKGNNARHRITSTNFQLISSLCRHRNSSKYRRRNAGPSRPMDKKKSIRYRDDTWTFKSLQLTFLAHPVHM